METALNLLGVLFVVVGLGSCTLASGPVSGVEGWISMLIAAVFFGAGAVVGRVDHATQTIVWAAKLARKEAGVPTLNDEKK